MPDRMFGADGKNRIWLGDMTYIPHCVIIILTLGKLFLIRC